MPVIKIGNACYPGALDHTYSFTDYFVNVIIQLQTVYDLPFRTTFVNDIPYVNFDYVIRRFVIPLY
uniref:Uncharacterized protein n=1 Tax=Romanomermis culicivorax TaxID=13658 RepID=A0A915K2C3_ROMCU